MARQQQRTPPPKPTLTLVSPLIITPPPWRSEGELISHIAACGEASPRGVIVRRKTGTLLICADDTRVLLLVELDRDDLMSCADQHRAKHTEILEPDASYLFGF